MAILQSDNNIILESKNLNIYYGNFRAVRDVNLSIERNKITAIIGPSGCGKSTLLRAFNRMNELVPDTRIEGNVVFEGLDLYDRNIDPVEVRYRIGMVFQKPNPFPTMSIYDNVAAGLRLTGAKKGKNLDEIVKKSLEQATLWDEVKDDLKKPGTSISGGQQQRLCIARAIALEPEVILMDEPTSALDPIASAKIEKLIVELKRNYTVAVVTHNMQQASRVSDYTAFLYLGSLIEYGQTRNIFEAPKNPLTEKYITGEFG